MDVTWDELHSIVNRQPCTDTSSRRIDVECDILFGIVVGKIEELGNEDVGHLVVHICTKEEDTVFEETGDDIKLTTGGTIDSGKWGWGTGLLLRFFGFVGVVLIVKTAEVDDNR